jgi:hypothetical protein
MECARCAAVVALMILVVSIGAAQDTPPVQAPPLVLPADLSKYPGLLPEFAHMFDKLQRNLQFPPARDQSRLLPLLPESTVFYAAFPNYGEVARQALTILRQELEVSSVLRDWWHGEMATEASRVEDFLEKVCLISQYLGGEIVVSGTPAKGSPGLLMVAEVRKSGLKELLQQVLKPVAGASPPAVRVLDPKQLETGEDGRAPQELIVLVRPDFVVAALDLATLRSFSSRLDRGRGEFVSGSFGQRVNEEYAGGLTLLAAADLHKILEQAPPGTDQNWINFQRTGFADMKYLVWERRRLAGQAVSQAELSFLGPRHGAASWLGAPSSLGSLDFVSPQPMLVGSVQLVSPAQIFEDVRELAAASSSNPLGTLEQMENALNLSLKEDLLRYLGGEVTRELDNAGRPAPPGMEGNPPGQRSRPFRAKVEYAAGRRPLPGGAVRRGRSHFLRRPNFFPAGDCRARLCNCRRISHHRFEPGNACRGGSIA